MKVCINAVCIFVLLGTALFVFCPVAHATAAHSVLVVGVTESPPFSFQEGGIWKGISLDIWRDVADKMQLDYEIRPYSVNELLEALRTGEADIGAAALFITVEREHFMNFSHSFYSGGLGIATKTTEMSIWRVFLSVLSGGEFLRVILLLGLVLFVMGFAIWLAEKKINPSQFPKNPLLGIGNGFWFSAVTMTTVGYGDRAPVSFLGKIIGLIWMFSSIVLISTFTGAVASTLTVSTLSPRIESFEDLYKYRVGTVEGSQATEFLRERGVGFIEFPDTVSGLDMLAEGKIDGFVNDEVLLRYLVNQGVSRDITVLERGFETGFYALGLKKDLPLRDEINLHLLEYVQGSEWTTAMRRYFGN